MSLDCANDREILDALRTQALERHDDMAVAFRLRSMAKVPSRSRGSNRHGEAVYSNLGRRADQPVQAR
jgi:hypothetical protein